MLIRLLNFSQNTVVWGGSNGKESCKLIVTPHQSASLHFPFPRVHLFVAALAESDVKGSTGPLTNITVSTKLCKAIAVPEHCPWRIYSFKVGRKEVKLVLLPKRNLASFLSEMPDTLSLRSLLLPGTHNTMAFYGWPFSQCQSPSTSLMVQLQSGIRVIDIRLAIINGRLIAYHGIYPQRSPFTEIVATIATFLTNEATRRETIVMSLKQEDSATTLFSKLVHDEVFDGPAGRDLWFLENRVPTLGEVRGKIVLFSRFGGNGDGWEGGLEGIGIHPTNWPDSPPEVFYWDCKETLVRTHDWYAIPSFLSIPEKVSRSTQLLLPPTESDRPTLSITYFSAAKFPLAFPPTIARGFGWPQWHLGVEGVNARVGKWLLDMLTSNDGEPRLRGWTLADYYADPDQSLAPLLVECNFRGRRGEDGW